MNIYIYISLEIKEREIGFLEIANSSTTFYHHRLKLYSCNSSLTHSLFNHVVFNYPEFIKISSFSSVIDFFSIYVYY